MIILAQTTGTNTGLLIGAIATAIALVGDRLFTYIKVFLNDRRLREAEKLKAEYLKDIRDSNNALTTEMKNLNNNMVKLQVTGDERHAANLEASKHICHYNKPERKEK